MYLFDGKFRSTPEQDLSGARRTDKKALLNKVHLERQKREELRAANSSAVKCQSAIRMFLSKSRLKKELRRQFDDIATSSGTSTECLLQQLNYFYDNKLDGPRIILLCDLLLKEVARVRSQCGSSTSWALRMSVFVTHVLSFVIYSLQEGIESKQPLAKCYRVIEAMMQIRSGQDGKDLENFVRFAIKRGFFRSLRQFADLKIPQLYEETVKAPTPMAQVIFDLVVQPFSVPNLRKEVCASIIDPFFSRPFSDSSRNFILPSLAHLGQKFPLSEVLSQISKDLSSDEARPSPWLLYSVVYLFTRNYAEVIPPTYVMQIYISVLSKLIEAVEFRENGPSEPSDDSDDEYEESEEMDTEEKLIKEKSLNMINSNEHVQIILLGFSDFGPSNKDTFNDICKICHSLLLSAKTTSMYFGLLRAVTNNTRYLRHLWVEILNTKQASLFGQGTPLLQLLNRGIWLSQEENEKIVPMLNVFCHLFKRYLFTVHDAEFFGESQPGGTASSLSMPFSLSEMAQMSVLLRELCVGLVELAYPESRTAVREMKQSYSQKVWISLFMACVSLVRHIHFRDTRRNFCPPGTWTTNRVAVPITPHVMTVKKVQKPFIAPASLTRAKMEEGPPLTTREVRSSAILHEVPFVVEFTDRVKLFHSLIQEDRASSQTNSEFLLEGNISVRVRRNFLYEDAFDRLSYENQPNIKKRMRIQLTNVVGLEEAGIDGGGIFREFMTELLKTAFDPNRGFFTFTEDNMLYPNPNVKLLAEDYLKHYFFIGRVLGKALYENLLVELPLADFFLSKLLGQSASSSDINSLASLDSTLHKNLLSLRDYNGDFSELGLDFTIVSDEFGETKVDELKPGGSNIPVTSVNKIEYIYLVADYKLNKQIQYQCSAFRQGLADVIPINWLRMFNHKELQILISGAEVPIDIEDLKQHAVYAGNYEVTHPIIKNFWTVVEGLTDEQKRKLLKFVTSCSRPPLLGFKELHPPFCIQSAGTELRLPTASTCMNLLKLPEIPDFVLLREKLLYAIESGAGFELS